MLPAFPDGILQRRPRNAAWFSAARHGRGVRRDALGVLALVEVRGHPAVARPADVDRVLDTLLRDGADLVQVRAGHALRTRGLEGVAAPAGLAEEVVAAVEVRARLLARQRATGAEAGIPIREHDRRDGDSERDIEDRNRDLEPAPTAGQVRVPRAAGAAPEGDVSDREAEREESDDEGSYRHAGGILPICNDNLLKRRGRTRGGRASSSRRQRTPRLERAG